MRNHYVFDTKRQAQLYCDEAFREWMKGRGGHYAETTRRWATPRQREDGKWVVPSCSRKDSARPMEQKLGSDVWYPEERDI